MTALTSNNDADKHGAWTRACETCLRTSNLTELADLLGQPPTPEARPAATFYRGHMAVGSANFDEAVRLFQDARREAQMGTDSLLEQRSLVWEAYSESQRGNYSRARHLVKLFETSTPTYDPIWADMFFVRGLIASEQETLPIAQEWLEKAHNVALGCQDYWMEARCCANLAVIYSSQGMLDHSLTMIRKVEALNNDATHVPTPNMRQMVQVRNIHVYNLRWRGELEKALDLGLSFPESTKDGTKLFAGYLALTTAMVAADLGDFSLAERLWEQAHTILHDVVDDQRTLAELIWEQAWLRLRQGKVEEAHTTIQEALFLINDSMETECFHAYVIAGVIAIRREDLGTVGLILRTAIERFRVVGHHLGLASTLLHVADYFLTRGRQEPGREALAEALTLMWRHQLYGTYYWHPQVMVRLCKEAMSGEVWADKGAFLAAHLFGIQEAEIPTYFALEGSPEDLWGEFATSLAVRRLAHDHWQHFTPLLSHARAQVRQRAVRVLCAAQHPDAWALLHKLRTTVDPELQQCIAEALTNFPRIQVFSFGQFKLLLNGETLHLRSVSTPKALLAFAAMLLMGEHGVNSSDLALLLWPERREKERRNLLQTTISYLRRELRRALDAADAGADVILASGGRYYLKLTEKQMWWDWRELCQMAVQERVSRPRAREVEKLYGAPFMGSMVDLVPPRGLDEHTEELWERVANSLRDIASEYEAEAVACLQQLRERFQQLHIG